MRGVAFVLAVLGLAGCSLGGRDEGVDELQVDRLVLQHDDLPHGFRRTSTARPETARPSARVRYEGGARADGVGLIDSAAEVFESEDAADAHVDRVRTALREAARWDPIGEPGVGDESVAATSVERGVSQVRAYRVVWRDARVVASLLVEGRHERLPLASVLELAHAQQKRIAEAAS